MIFLYFLDGNPRNPLGDGLFRKCAVYFHPKWLDLLWPNVAWHPGGANGANGRTMASPGCAPARGISAPHSAVASNVLEPPRTPCLGAQSLLNAAKLGEMLGKMRGCAVGAV